MSKGWDPGLTFHTMLPDSEIILLHCVAVGVGKGMGKQSKEKGLEDADVQVP